MLEREITQRFYSCEAYLTEFTREVQWFGIDGVPHSEQSFILRGVSRVQGCLSSIPDLFDQI